MCWIQARRSNQLDVFRAHFHGGGQQGGDFHQQAFHLGSARGDQRAFAAVKASAENADPAGAHVRSDFFRKIVTGGFHRLHGTDEAFHFLPAHGHRLAVGVTQEAVLEGAYLGYYFIEGFAGVVDKNQVVQVGYFPTHPSAIHQAKFPHHRRKEADVLLFQHLVSRHLGVAPRQIAHGKPLRSSLFCAKSFCFCHRFTLPLHVRSQKTNPTNPARYFSNLNNKQLQSFSKKALNFSNSGFRSFPFPIIKGCTHSSRHLACIALWPISS